MVLFSDGKIEETAGTLSSVQVGVRACVSAGVWCSGGVRSQQRSLAWERDECGETGAAQGGAGGAAVVAVVEVVRCWVSRGETSRQQCG